MHGDPTHGSRAVVVVVLLLAIALSCVLARTQTRLVDLAGWEPWQLVREQGIG